MPVKVKLTGWTELRDALTQLPQAFVAEAAAVVKVAGEGTAADLKAAYPPGELRDKVRVRFSTTRLGVRSTVTSGSAWANAWEFGTNSRHTQQGWNRGAEPAHPDRGLITIAKRYGQTMNLRLADMVRRAGFSVTGETS